MNLANNGMSVGFESHSYDTTTGNWTSQFFGVTPVSAEAPYVMNFQDQNGKVVQHAILYTDYTNYIVLYNENAEGLVAARRNWMPDQVGADLLNEINERVGIPTYRFRKIYHGQAERDAQIAQAEAEAAANGNNANPNPNNAFVFPNFG